MKAAQQSKSAGKSKADSHPADPRTMMSQDSKKSGTSKSKSRQVKTVRHIFSVKCRDEPSVHIPDHGDDSNHSTTEEPSVTMPNDGENGDHSTDEDSNNTDADMPPLLSRQ